LRVETKIGLSLDHYFDIRYLYTKDHASLFYSPGVNCEKVYTRPGDLSKYTLCKFNAIYSEINRSKVTY